MGNCHVEVACCGVDTEPGNVTMQEMAERNSVGNSKRYNPLSESRKQFLTEWMRSGKNMSKIEKSIIQIQAAMRGKLVRMRLRKLQQLLQAQRDEIGGKFDESITEEHFLFNPRVREVYRTQGPFKIPETQFVSLVNKCAYKLRSGVIYQGQWSKDLKTRVGKGKQAWLDGSLYEGQWMNGKANGIGRLIHADGDIYIGEWSNDKANGHGRYVHYDGQIYEGQWQNDRQHGKGVETWQDGARYEGSYVRGRKHGKGKFNWGDGAQYIGDFGMNDIQGRGKYTWSDGRAYDGEWYANKMQGRGVFNYPDGRRYEGYFMNDKKHGHGVMTMPDGRKFDGEWRNGRQHGEGQIQNTDQSIQKGKWVEGRPVCWYDEDGNRIVTKSDMLSDLSRPSTTPPAKSNKETKLLKL